MYVGLQAKVRACGFGLWLRLNAGCVCDAQRRGGGICGLRRHISLSVLEMLWLCAI